MIEQKHRDETCDEKWRKYQHSPAGKIMAGIWVVVIGALLLTRQMGFPYPEWLFTWPSMLIAIGVYIGARHMFCNPGWFILVIIGALFLWDHLTPEMSLSTYIWPILIILAGIVMIVKPQKHKHFPRNRRRFRHRRYAAEQYADQHIPTDSIHTEEENDMPHWQKRKIKEEISQQDYLESIAIFGAVRKSIVSKTFKGGDIVCVFGGAEINLMQADIQGRVTLDITCVFGGAKLIIPSNWDVQPETMAILGGIEDKRQINNTTSTDKILVLTGVTCLGGIEIKSF
jgi:predicted membrane protein